MKRVLIDTNVYVAFKRGDRETLKEIQNVDYIGLCPVVLGELLSGFKAGAKEKKNRKELEEFLENPRVSIVEIGEETAEFYSEIYLNLRKKGTPVPTNDIWIAACAMERGLVLYTFDIHFKNIDGLLLK